MNLDITGRTAVVCASTSGLGEAISRALAAEGAHVVVSGRRGERARQIADELPSAVGVEVDLTDPAGDERLLASAREAFGEVDILILNGPGPRSGPAAHLSLPGRMATDRAAALDQAAADRSGRSIDDVREQSLAQIPAGRLGDPAEFGSVGAFLCSEQASYVTGTAVRCDGGWVRSL